jgi:hypothetical protein
MKKREAERFSEYDCIITVNEKCFEKEWNYISIEQKDLPSGKFDVVIKMSKLSIESLIVENAWFSSIRVLLDATVKFCLSYTLVDNKKNTVSKNIIPDSVVRVDIYNVDSWKNVHADDCKKVNMEWEQHKYTVIQKVICSMKAAEQAQVKTVPTLLFATWFAVGTWSSFSSATSIAIGKMDANNVESGPSFWTENFI